ncbi:MAG: ATP-NAD kinase family protein [Candidatus Bathyarchaeota archaeon]|nr:ATP-NAD kinase family protein [Candidatus Bathyarchaeota archaeon]MDH5732355.1 ATP-NAD kinase family protein [Candidatus Bathyarchaeota archaeon]
MKIGFIVNPIAGMGGRVGLKGTDNLLERAIEMGAKPVAPSRAVEFLSKLKTLASKPITPMITCPGTMGEDETKTATFPAIILPMRQKSKTSAEDTKSAVKRVIREEKVDLIVFVGGDGTAKDILDAMQDVGMVPVLGVPSGVKMYSGIFAVNPSVAAEVVKAFSEGATQLMDFEIMDADENAIRRDRFSVRLYGFLKGPFVPMRLQGSKQVSPETVDEHENQMAVARFIVENMDPDGTYILGPGTTVKCVADLLGVEKTLLGVDIYRDKTLMKDVNEKKIIQEVTDCQNTWIIISPIGRQGMLFGRGNQQITPEIIRKVGKERIVVAATTNKIQSIEEGILRVDTGDPETDNLLKGYLKVVTDYKEWRIMKVQ